MDKRSVKVREIRQFRIAAIPGGCNPPALTGFRWFESNSCHKNLCAYASLAEWRLRVTVDHVSYELTPGVRFSQLALKGR